MSTDPIKEAAEKYWKDLEATGMAHEFSNETVATRAYMAGFAAADTVLNKQGAVAALQAAKAEIVAFREAILAVHDLWNITRFNATFNQLISRTTKDYANLITLQQDLYNLLQYDSRRWHYAVTVCLTQDQLRWCNKAAADGRRDTGSIGDEAMKSLDKERHPDDLAREKKRADVNFENYGKAASRIERLETQLHALIIAYELSTLTDRKILMAKKALDDK